MFCLCHVFTVCPLSYFQGHRDESGVVDPEAAFNDAQALLQAGELLFAGTDESTFNQVMCQRNRKQLKLVFDEYEKLVGHPIETAIENEFSGDIKDALLSLIACIRDKYDYLATRLHDSMAGMGTDDRTLIRIIVSRSEIDLKEIKEVYEAKYGKTLADRVAVSILILILLMFMFFLLHLACQDLWGFLNKAVDLYILQFLKKFSHLYVMGMFDLQTHSRAQPYINPTVWVLCILPAEYPYTSNVMPSYQRLFPNIFYLIFVEHRTTK